jgi:hypothetical protein
MFLPASDNKTQENKKPSLLVEKFHKSLLFITKKHRPKAVFPTFIILKN